MTYKFNNKNIHDYDLWCHDNNDKLYDYFHDSGAHHDQFQQHFYEDIYDTERNTI